MAKATTSRASKATKSTAPTASKVTKATCPPRAPSKISKECLNLMYENTLADKELLQVEVAELKAQLAAAVSGKLVGANNNTANAAKAKTVEYDSDEEDRVWMLETELKREKRKVKDLQAKLKACEAEKNDDDDNHPHHYHLHEDDDPSKYLLAEQQNVRGLESLLVFRDAEIKNLKDEEERRDSNELFQAKLDVRGMKGEMEAHSDRMWELEDQARCCPNKGYHGYKVTLPGMYAYGDLSAGQKGGSSSGSE